MLFRSVEIIKNKREEDKEVLIGVLVTKATGKKCERCWMYSETVGEDKENPEICHRCSQNLK